MLCICKGGLVQSSQDNDSFYSYPEQSNPYYPEQQGGNPYYTDHAEEEARANRRNSHLNGKSAAPE